MKKFKRIMTTFLSMALMITALGACKPAEQTEQPPASGQSNPSAEEAGKVDTSKPVELTMYLLGDRPADNDEVFGKINDRLKEKINATINVKYMGWGEYEQKYPLIFASGEDWDMIYTSDWCFYNAQASKDGFWEISQEALKKYAPLSAETMYPEAWEQAKVNDKVYMLPMNYKEITAYVYLVRGDLMEKYGVKSVASLDEAEAYMDKIVAGEQGLIPLDVGSDYDKLFVFDRMWSKALYETDKNLIGVNPWQIMGTIHQQGEPDVTANCELPAYEKVVGRLKDWKDRGFWSKNAVVNTQKNTESFEAGKSALALCNANTAKSIYAKINQEHPEWKIQVFDAQENVPPVQNAYLANGMGIFSKSANPERALMALDLLRNDKEINSLFCYGIEGKHWKAVGENGLESLPESANYPYDGNCNWGVRNDANWRLLEGGIPNLHELNDMWTKNAAMSTYQTFVFDDSKVKNEIAAMTEIFNSEYKLLGLGFSDDIPGDIAKLKEKMQAAGADKVYQAVNEQAQAFKK